MLNTKAPLTLQDASALWGILNFYSLERAHVEVYILQSEDEELKIFLKSFLKNTLKKEINSLKQILSDNNIDYSINYPNRNINLTFELNEATKFRDMEIAMIMLQTLRAALPVLSGVIMNSYSQEVIVVVSGYYNGFLENMKTVLKLINKKNWSRRPPMIHILNETK